VYCEVTGVRSDGTGSTLDGPTTGRRNLVIDTLGRIGPTAPVDQVEGDSRPIDGSGVIARVRSP